MNRTRENRRIEAAFFTTILILISLAAIWLSKQEWLPPLASEHGASIDRLLRYLLITVGLLFLVGHLTLGGFIFLSSRRSRVTHVIASPKVEWRWALIPAILMALVAEGGVLVLGLPIWKDLYGGSPPAEAITIEVTAEQFAWNVRYPGKDGTFGRTNPHLIAEGNPLGLDKADSAARDDIVKLGVLYLPANQPVRIRLRSKDTLHSFFLPNFRIKQDAVPGIAVEVWFTPTKVGHYELACAELCGLGHFQMRGILEVMPPEEFERWLSEQEPALSGI